MREGISVLAGMGLDSWVKLEQEAALPFLGAPRVSPGDSEQSRASPCCERSLPAASPGRAAIPQVTLREKCGKGDGRTTHKVFASRAGATAESFCSEPES